MRIAQVSTLSALVEPLSGGSVEALVWLLSRELIEQGHEVTVFAVAGSTSPGELVATLPGPYATHGAPDDWHLCEWIHLCQAVSESGRFDVMHTHTYLWAIPLEPFARCPLVHTAHIVPDDDMAGLWRRRPAACVTALSAHQWSGYPDLKPTALVPHGLDVTQFQFRASPEDYVCYLGRFTSGKGPIQAIQIAREAGVRLRLAGPSNAYFREKVQPLLDGDQIQYVGYVSGDDRNRLLGGAKALLYPIQYPEAFGLVLAESMLCGTPVAAIGHGAVPEIIEPGVTGCIAKGTQDLAALLPTCFSLNRKAVRSHAEQRFSARRMAQDYLKVYHDLRGRSCS